MLPEAAGREQHFKPKQIICLFFSCSKLALQITNGFVNVALVIPWACAPSTNDL